MLLGEENRPGLTNRLDASTVKLTDFSELREKMNAMHIINERVDLVTSNITRIEDQIDSVKKLGVDSSKELILAQKKIEDALSLTTQVDL